MRRFFFALILGATAGMISSHAQDNGAVTNSASSDGTPPAGDQATVVQTFTGTGSSVTVPFQVQNKWEVRWTCHGPLSVTVFSADHNVVAGTMGVNTGSFFLPAGGIYYMQIDGPAPPAAASNPSPVMNPGSTTNQASATNSMPTGTSSDGTGGETADHGGNPTNASPANDPRAALEQIFKWNVQVVALGVADSTPSGTNFVPPDPNAVPPPAEPAPVVPTNQTDDPAVALVLIAGDNAQGTGFLIKSSEGLAVVTNLHVIADNPNLKLTTATGAQLTMLSAKGASDRDVALLAVQDGDYSYLSMSTDISRKVQIGDEILTAGNSPGDGGVIRTQGGIFGIGPERIEFNNPIRQGSGGGPIVHPKSGKVLGVVTEPMKIDAFHDPDKDPFASRNRAPSGPMRAYGLRLDTVSNWVPIDWKRFQSETAFLDQFDLQSRALDSYLNPSKPGLWESNYGGNTGVPGGGPKLFLSDKKITAARDSFVKQTIGADSSGRAQALHGLIFDLNDVADTDMQEIQDTTNFYSFDQQRAKDEIAYRKSLKAELEDIDNNPVRLDNLPRATN